MNSLFFCKFDVYCNKSWFLIKFSIKSETVFTFEYSTQSTSCNGLSF
jgi:hypothetical protein